MVSKVLGSECNEAMRGTEVYGWVDGWIGENILPIASTMPVNIAFLFLLPSSVKKKKICGGLAYLEERA